MVTRTGGLHRHYPLPLSVSRKGLSDTLQCKERDSQRMAGSAYFVPSGRKTWPFRQNIREMYPPTAFFQPKAYKMRLSRQNRLSEGTFQRYLARKRPFGCAGVQNAHFPPCLVWNLHHTHLSFLRSGPEGARRFASPSRWRRGCKAGPSPIADA